jgi:hypothetical protein
VRLRRREPEAAGHYVGDSRRSSIRRQTWRFAATTGIRASRPNRVKPRETT